MFTLINSLAPIQIGSLVALGVLLSLILAVFIICLIRALRIVKPVYSSPDSLDKDFSPDENLYAKNLSDMLKLPTISTADSTACADKFKSLIFSLYPRLAETCEYKDFDGGIMLTWTGENHIKPLVMMSHYDVAPIKGEWEHAPFSGDIDNGIVHGRGAVDTKGNLCAILESCESLIADGFIPKRDIIIFSSSKEEVAGDDALKASKYLKDNGIIPILVIDEGGAMLDNPLVGVRGNFAMIAMCERARSTISISADSAEKLNKFFKKAKKFKLSKPTFSPEVSAMFAELTPYMAFPMKLIFANLWLFKDLLLGLLPKVSNEAKAMIATTFGHSDITQDDSTKLYTATATIASTFYNDIDSCVEKFINLCKKHDITATIKTIMYTCRPEPLFSDGYNLVADTVKTTFEDVVPSPFILFGGTDSRHFVGVADSVIRFAPLHLTHKEFGSFHNGNEQIHIDAISGAVCFFRELIKKSC